MSRLGRAVRDRLLPAVLTAAGVTLLAAGLLNYADGASAADPGLTASPSATPVTISPAPGSSLLVPTFPPIDASGAPSASLEPSIPPNPDRVATRIVIEALGIDLPVVKPPGDENTYPLCNVAMYIQELSQPGQGKATYLYAHARDGMFGPIYERAILRKSGGPSSLKGLLVQVYTSDDLLFEYETTEVRLHQTSLADAQDATTEQLWLQTSEGYHIPGKTQVIAQPLAVFQADDADAHPKPHPVVCG